MADEQTPTPAPEPPPEGASTPPVVEGSAAPAPPAKAESAETAPAERSATAKPAGDAADKPAKKAKPEKKKKKKGLPEKELVLVGSSSPHVVSDETIPRIMYAVCIALAPAILVGIYCFGLQAVKVLLLTAAACIATEAGLQRLMGRKITVIDGSALVTGLLLAMTLPPSAPWWICTIGGMLAIGVGKQLFGGLAHNPFNPALISRVILLISWPVELTTWMKPGQGFANLGVDVVTAATPLGLMKEELIQKGSIHVVSQFHLMDGLFGLNQLGSLGETSVIALLVGGIFLFYRGYITWHIPVGYVTAVGAVAALFWGIDPSRFAPPAYHLMTGGLFLGAIYMATDMVTCPVTNRGMLIFGIGCGILTYFIRTFGSYPEGVSFAIVIINGAVPLIERWVRPRTYGHNLSAAS